MALPRSNAGVCRNRGGAWDISLHSEPALRLGWVRERATAMTGVFHGFVNVDDPIQDSAAPVAGPTDLRQQRVPARSQQRDADALLRRREFVELVASLLVTAALPLSLSAISRRGISVIATRSASLKICAPADMSA